MKKGLSILTAVLLMAGLFLPAFAAAEEISGPSRPAGFVLPIMMNDRETRECFFANGTPITIQEPKADTAGWVHDKEIQKSLKNGFSPKKRPGTGALISWEEGQETRFVYVSGHSKVFGGRSCDRRGRNSRREREHRRINSRSRTSRRGSRYRRG